MQAMARVDYRASLDADVWAFIEETESWYPPGTHEQTVEEQRAVYDAMCRAFFNGYPDGVAVRDVMAGYVPLRVYEAGPSEAVVLYFHGGGFVVGGLDSHDDVCADICAATGLRVVSVDYRLSPEFTRDDALSDAILSLGWVIGHGATRVVLAGDSAGGFLAAALTHARRRRPEIAGQVLIYPGLGGDAAGSMARHAMAPLLSADEVRYYRSVLETTETTVPLRDADFSGLPPTFTVGAEYDPICDDAGDYAQAIRAAGGVAVGAVDAGLVHGHLRARHQAKRAGDSFARVCRVIARMAAGDVDQAGLEAAAR